MLQRNQLNGTRPSETSLNQGYTSLPVGVSVSSAYSDSLLQASPQMPHNSVSPRPGSSNRMLDIPATNGYSGQPSPGMPVSSSPGLIHKVHLSNKDNSASTSTAARNNVRVTVHSSSQPSHMNVKTTSSLSVPVVSLATPPQHTMGYPSTLANSFLPSKYSLSLGLPDDLSLSASDLTALSSYSTSSMLHGWPSQPTATLAHISSSGSSLSHLAMNSPSPTPQSTSPLIKIKDEPNSPQREGSNCLNSHILHRPLSTSPGHMASGVPSPASSQNSDYECTLNKRPRLTVEGWPT